MARRRSAAGDAMTARVGRLVVPDWTPDFVPEGVTPACREPGVDPEWFFPLGENYSNAGRKVCRRCPLEQACAEWAVAPREPYSLWDGLTPIERMARRRAW